MCVSEVQKATLRLESIAEKLKGLTEVVNSLRTLLDKLLTLLQVVNFLEKLLFYYSDGHR